MRRKMFVVYGMVSRGPNIISDYASRSWVNEDEEEIQQFSQNLALQLKQHNLKEYEMQSFHQENYSYHMMKILDNICLLWVTTNSDDSPTKANIFLNSLEEQVSDILKSNDKSDDPESGNI